MRFMTFFMAAFPIFYSSPVIADDSYTQSSCYKEYQGEYQKRVEATQRSLRSRAEVSMRIGVVLHQPTITVGKMEKSILNAADSSGTYNPRMIDRPYYLNDFHYIHNRVLKTFGEADPQTTQRLIRKGFAENAFCSKFLFFDRRADKDGVAKYVIKQMREELESSAIADAAVNDSEIGKEEGAGSATDSSGKSASGASVQNH